MSRILVVILTVVAVVVTSAEAAINMTKGPGTTQITPQSTGIYTMASVHKDTRVLHSIALFHKGQMMEIHTRVDGGAYLNRKAGSTPIKIPTSKFNQLITAAGGIDRDVEKLPAAEKNEFYQIAGIAAGSTPSGSSKPLPKEVQPDAAGHCPSGYRLDKPFPKAAGKCVLISQGPSPLALAWQKVFGVARAEAVIHELNFSLANFFGNIAFTYNDQENVYRFQGFGFQIVWDDQPHG